MTDSTRIYDDLSRWWDESARDFPWRFGRTTPWGVLISEVMSQQTPMTRVLPYWVAWMQMWPTARELAKASVAEVITAWGTLGYPRRALRLQECARVVSEQYGGELPQTYEELIALPGVGDYTASAVLAFAFGKRSVVIDTNIRRVISRAVQGEESRGGSATAVEKKVLAECVPTDTKKSVVWNQSTMELGAVICTAQSPKCDECPIRDSCAFYAAGLPGLGVKRTRPPQKFAGTNRQVRGLILKELRGAAGLSLPYEKISQIWDNSVQFDECLASLDNDGLVVINADHSVSLPQ